MGQAGFVASQFALRVAVTVAVIVVVFGARYTVRRWRGRDGSIGEITDLAVAAAVAVLTVGGVVAIIGVWGLESELRQAVVDLGLQDVAGKVLVSGVLLGATYALTGLVGRMIGAITGRGNAISDHQREVVYRLTQVTLYGIVGLVIVSLFTQDLSGLLVGAGFVGIVVGMAARQTLGAVLAGFVLMFSRPFEVGDWVAIGDHEGVVTEITVVTTRIQTFDGEFVMLPNDEVSGSAITNRSRKGRLRVEVEVGVDYDADPAHAARVALEAIEDADEVLDVPSPQAVRKRFADSAVVLGVRFWIDEPSARRMWRARTDVVDAIHEAFADADIKIPFPQRELAARTETGGFRLAREEERETDPPATADGGDGGGDR
jgi:small-conductance mechanosensitive channel